jgi:hypothetical protein
MAKKCIIWCLVAAMFILGIMPRLEAAFVSSQAIDSKQLDRVSDLQVIQSALEDKLVRQRLQDLGFTSDEVRDRLALLNEEQLHSIAQKLDDLRVGQDSGLGIVIAVLVIIILVIVIINLTTGHKVTVTK